MARTLAYAGLKAAALALAAFAVALCAGCGEVQSESLPAASSLRYDGLYCFIYDYQNDGFTDNMVLRFYEEGDVLSVTVSQTATEAGYFPKSVWFYRENPEYPGSIGFYTLDGAEISFTVAGAMGTVDYWGTVTDDGLILSSHSNINGHEVKDRAYTFYPFSEIPNW